MFLPLIFTIAIITALLIVWLKSKTKTGSSSVSGGEWVEARIEAETNASTNSSSFENGDIDSLDLALESKILECTPDLGRECRDSSSSATVELLPHKKKLEGVLKARVSLAVDRCDHPTILRFIKLFKPLGLEEQGLQIFVSYLRKVVSTREANQWVQLTEQLNGNNTANYEACLRILLQGIVSAVDENDEILRDLCGEGGMVYAFCELQKECDSRGSNILKEFMHLPVYSYKELLPDLSEIELHIQDVLPLAQLCERYMENMRSKIRRVMDLELESKAIDAITMGYFINVSWDISNFYVKLERFFIKKNVWKAIQINERKPNSIISSMVDDVFYVLWTSISRAISTSSPTCVNGVLKCAVDLLKDVYTNAVKHNVDYFGLEQTLSELAIALNNYELSIENTSKLLGRIEEQRREESWKDDYGLASVKEHFELCLSAGTHQLVDTVESQIKPILKSIETIVSDGEATWVQRLIDALDTNITCLEPLMTATNYDTCTYRVIRLIVDWFLDETFTPDFLESKHEQFSREINQLLSHLWSMARRPLEDILDHQMERCVDIVTSRIELILQSAKTIDSDDQEIYADEADPWMQRLIGTLHIKVAWLEPLMSATNYDTLSYRVILSIVTWLHDEIFTLSFDESGHEQLLKDVSKLAAHLPRIARRPIDNLLDVLMEKLAATVTPRIKPILDSVKAIGSGGEAVSEGANTWGQTLIDALETNVARFKPLMSATNYDTFAYVVIDFTVTRLDGIVISLNFSEVPLEQLREDIEKLASYLARMTQRPITSQLNTLQWLVGFTYEPPLILQL